MEAQIIIPIAKFKEILLHSWHLLPEDKQRELSMIGIYPKSQSPRD
jgi:hypothetical protein